jgi:hypothetical protein
VLLNMMVVKNFSYSVDRFTNTLQFCAGTRDVPCADCRRCMPIIINRADYFMSGSIWRKFRSRLPDVPFDDFWSNKI